ncbi:hypothetical protein PINS_up024079, partial [Pythium insidiosum]
LVYDAKKSATLPWNASERAVETELRTLAQRGDFLVLFLSRLGPNQPLMSCDRSGLSSTANGATLACDVVRTSPGVRPVMNSPLYGSVVVDKAALLAQSRGLTVGAAYHVRVSAWNGVGNVFGSSKYSTPARVIAQTRPDGPKDLRVSAVSDTALLATWTPPLNAGGAQVARFDLQLDATTGVAEQQSVQRSAPIPWDATADAVFAALQALQALQPIVAGVSRRQIALGGVGFEWIVTFTTAAGNVALLTADGSTLRGTDSDHGPRARARTAAALRVAVADVARGPAARRGAGDLDLLSLAYRFAWHRDAELLWRDDAADRRVTASSDTIGQALEDSRRSTPPVDVSTQLSLARQSTHTRQRYGVQWLVTFSGTTRRRRTAAARVHEHGANRRGRRVSRARVWRHVARSSALRAHRELVAGGLITQALLTRPTTSATTNDTAQLSPNQAAFVSDWSTLAAGRWAPQAHGHRARAPRRGAALHWAPRGVSQYKVQWDVTTAFDQQSSSAGSLTVAASAATGANAAELELCCGASDADLPSATFATALTGLDSTQRYVVRVLAYNALGYGRTERPSRRSQTRRHASRGS